VSAKMSDKTYKLSEEERVFLDSYEADEWRTVEKLEDEKSDYRQYASATFKKDKRVNIRISTKNLEALQKKALEEGIPYQTLISSVLHKYINGRLVEK
jgi:predicted DNA binding CopG/RHH family protein